MLRWLIELLRVPNPVTGSIFGHGGFGRDGGVECCCEAVAEVLGG